MSKKLNHDKLELFVFYIDFKSRCHESTRATPVSRWNPPGIEARIVPAFVLASVQSGTIEKMGLETLVVCRFDTGPTFIDIDGSICHPPEYQHESMFWSPIFCNFFVRSRAPRIGRRALSESQLGPHFQSKFQVIY